MTGILALVASGFWMLMIFDCLRNDPEKNTWIWILIFLSIPGAVIYFLVRRAPMLNLPMPNSFKQLTRRQELWSAEAAARNIGKAHQYVNLGNILYEVGERDKASAAYQQALEKESANPHALWGMALLEIDAKKFHSAKEYLQKLFQIEPDYKFGDASLAYGKMLFELQEWDAAKLHLERDIKQWSHPEASVMLATIYAKQGESKAAYNCLETMLFKVRSSPMYHYRRHQTSIKKAEKLLKALKD